MSMLLDLTTYGNQVMGDLKSQDVDTVKLQYEKLIEKAKRK